jgi:hypothetical protein
VQRQLKAAAVAAEVHHQAQLEAANKATQQVFPIGKKKNTYTHIIYINIYIYIYEIDINIDEKKSKIPQIQLTTNLNTYDKTNIQGH